MNDAAHFPSQTRQKKKEKKRKSMDTTLSASLTTIDQRRHSACRSEPGSHSRQTAGTGCASSRDASDQERTKERARQRRDDDSGNVVTQEPDESQIDTEQHDCCSRRRQRGWRGGQQCREHSIRDSEKQGGESSRHGCSDNETLGQDVRRRNVERGGCQQQRAYEQQLRTSSRREFSSAIHYVVDQECWFRLRGGTELAPKSRRCDFTTNKEHKPPE